MTVANLRLATPDDAESLGVIHVASWRETYADILPAETLAKFKPEDRTLMWAGILTERSALAGTSVWIAEAFGRTVGFGSCGTQRDPNLALDGFDGEISAIYILRSSQGSGLGRTIMRALGATLRGKGHSAAALWVLKENPIARGFYDHLGGTVIAEKEDERLDATIVKVAYGWRDLGLLIL